MQTNDINSLKQQGIHVTDKTQFYYPVMPEFSKASRIKTFKPSMLSKAYKLKYYYNDKRIAFIDENGEFYIIRYTKENVQILKDYGFTLAEFFIPGELHSYPLRHKTHWEEMMS